MAIERFEVGKKYRWVGPDKPSEWSIPDDMSKIWEEGNAHKLLAADFDNNAYLFDGIVSTEFDLQEWAYNDTEENFEEVVE